MCDMEQRFHTENINLLAQSSKELIYEVYWCGFKRLWRF